MNLWCLTRLNFAKDYEKDSYNLDFKNIKLKSMMKVRKKNLPNSYMQKN